jgi:hypothetical protein
MKQLPHPLIAWRHYGTKHSWQFYLYSPDVLVVVKIPLYPQYGELVEFLCKCSFLEIYNEQVYDLLDSASSGLHLRENMKHGVYVDGLTETSVLSAKEAYQVLATGWVNRKVASTSMNRESSRSHAVFTLSVESKKRVSGEKRDRGRREEGNREGGGER